MSDLKHSLSRDVEKMPFPECLGHSSMEWLDVDAENLKGSVKELPAREAIDVPVDEMLIVELYSK